MNAPIDISAVVLQTERLTLRPWRETDLEDFYAYASVVCVLIFYGEVLLDAYDAVQPQTGRGGYYFCV